MDGEVGDASRVLAAADALRQRRYDVVSAFPDGLSRWLNMDMPRRLEQLAHLPVHYFIATRANPY